jgi:hypothetical protein
MVNTKFKLYVYFQFVGQQILGKGKMPTKQKKQNNQSYSHSLPMEFKDSSERKIRKAQEFHIKFLLKTYNKKN